MYLGVLSHYIMWLWSTTKFKRSGKGGFLQFKLRVVVSLGGLSPGTIHTWLVDKLYTD